ncbi:MAG: Smr/MutS family protein [Candidatus Aegiribacteria sp.]|nr:Smr/MutS family protein [Candidatus Aegiribacteria sp.]
MNNSLLRLEYHLVLEEIANRAISSMGKEKAEALQPGWNSETSSRLQAETESASFILEQGIHPPSGSLDDLKEITDSIDSGIIIFSPRKLRNTGNALRDMDQFVRSLEEISIESKRILHLQCYCDRIPRLSKLSGRLLRMTTPEGDLSPDASPELTRLNKKADRLERNLSKRINKISVSLSRDNIIRDFPPTLRDGRYVLPVISSRKREVKGIVHDRSDSGETVYIEPSQLVDDGNSLREALLDLDFERRKILREISLSIREHSDELRAGTEAVSTLDAIFARASYHKDLRTVFPSEGSLSLLCLKHPLIPSEEVIENDVRLPEDWKALIISGPNAGGKSVLLKAIGLAVICAQSGIGACVSTGSTIPYFNRIHVSIGDQQSIANHQSTYSARLREQLDMLNDHGSGGLVLIDEPAAGTDPLTGSALAASLLDHLADADNRLVVTTHQGQLKSLAHGKPGFYNGCMNFHEDTLEPDYTFTFGIPGSSFTLEIARKMNFPAGVLERAETLSGDSFKLDRMLEEIASIRSEIQQRSEELDREQEKDRLIRERMNMDLESSRTDLERTKKRIEEQSKEWERSINSQADALLSRLAKTETAQERRSIRSEIREISGSSSGISLKDECKKSKDKNIVPGEWVTVKGWSGKGMVEELGKDHAVVILGNLRLKKPFSDLCATVPPEEKPVSSDWSVPVQTRIELNLRGMSADEALAELDSALDDSIVAGIPQIRVIHGKGKGILMRVVIDSAKTDRRVASFRQGRPSEGGTGVTIIILNPPEES